MQADDTHGSIPQHEDVRHQVQVRLGGGTLELQHPDLQGGTLVAGRTVGELRLRRCPRSRLEVLWLAGGVALPRYLALRAPDAAAATFGPAGEALLVGATPELEGELAAAYPQVNEGRLLRAPARYQLCLGFGFAIPTLPSMPLAFGVMNLRSIDTGDGLARTEGHGVLVSGWLAGARIALVCEKPPPPPPVCGAACNCTGAAACKRLFPHGHCARAGCGLRGCAGTCSLAAGHGGRHLCTDGHVM